MKSWLIIHHNQMSKKKLPAITVGDKQLEVVYVPISSLKPHPKNPRVWSDAATEQLAQSIKNFGLVDPLVINSAPGRENLIIGGNFRFMVAKQLGYEEVPVVFISVPDEDKELELLVRLNKNVGEFDWAALAEFGEQMLADTGFSSEELDEIFPVE